ncbi:MAG TPA: hypothetical protein DCZ91_19380 [Lachnospiraceae bacterium]|nr:hypothetical protein [Lachnospiraceae bacterium]
MKRHGNVKISLEGFSAQSRRSTGRLRRRKSMKRYEHVKVHIAGIFSGELEEHRMGRTKIWIWYLK